MGSGARIQKKYRRLYPILKKLRGSQGIKHPRIPAIHFRAVKNGEAEMEQDVGEFAPLRSRIKIN